MPEPQTTWGPSHEKPSGQKGGPVWFRLGMVVAVGLFLAKFQTWVGFVVLIGGWFLIAMAIQITKQAGAEQRDQLTKPPESADPLNWVVEQSLAHDAGVYLGLSETGGWMTARPERAVLLLGPPRAGKTSGVIVPALLSHPGAAVSTSTKPDVLAASAGARSRFGKVWEFDPTGRSWAGVGERLHWSPVFASRNWEDALLMARAMVAATGVGIGTTDQTHWSRRAQSLLAPLLHAAALGGREIDAVLEWVMRHDLDQPGLLLTDNGGSPVAVQMLIGLANTEERERSSIFSAAADALDAYSSEAALNVARSPNFNPARFVKTADTVYIHSPAEHQRAAAPLVCGLLADIRRATYARSRERALARNVLFALDEVANIAPLDELPQIASEGGGQGLSLLAALQDLSQARARWGPAAEGFLTLFGSKVILPGIADTKTLEGISVALGEYDRQMVSTTRGRVPNPRGGLPLAQKSDTISTQRQRVLSPGEIANIPTGKALHLDGVTWQLVTLTPVFRTEPWKTLSELPIKGSQ